MKILKSVSIYFIPLCFFTLSYGQSRNYHNLSHRFDVGEELEYMVSYGIIKIAKATTRIDHNMYKYANRTCYKVDAFGKTLNWISWVSRVDDHWGAYIDAASFATHISYRYIKEGKYRKNEWVTFDHQKDSATVQNRDFKTGKKIKTTYHKIPDNACDIVGGFMSLRVIDFNTYHPGDSLFIKGFFEDTSYTLKIIYMGTETIQSPMGKISCHKLLPIMPDNKLFDGEQSIKCWLSADSNQVPIRIYAKMFLGGIKLELVKHKGLKHPIQKK